MFVLSFFKRTMLAVLLLTGTAQAQNTLDFNFDSSIFDDSSLFDGKVGSPRLFTFKLSQQTYGHINKHDGADIYGQQDIQNRGTEINRTGLLLKYQNPFAQGWLVQGSAQAKAYWSGDYEYRANGDSVESDLRINELFVQRSGERHSIRFGRQTIVWGETEGNSVLDIINTSEFRDLTIIDIEDARRNQWLLVWDYYGDRNSGSWSSFVNLYPEFNPAPVLGSPFFFEPKFNLSDYRREQPLFEAGTRWSRSFTGSDIAVMGAYLYENQLRYFPPLDGRGDALAEKNGFWLLGFSANRAIGKLLLKFDLAYNHELLTDTVIFQQAASQEAGLQPQTALQSSRKRNQLGTSFGFEYAISNEQNISIGVLAQRFLNADKGLPANEFLLSDETAGNILLRYSNSMNNNNLLFSVTAQSALGGDSQLLSLAASYSLNDNWALMSQLIATRASKKSALYFLDQDLRLGATLSYSF
jgi:hypothetical protein